MTKKDPADVIDLLREQYTRDYKLIERWRDYGLGGDFPADLAEDETFRAELITDGGRKAIASGIGLYRLEVRQLMACPPEDEYSLAEFMKLCDQMYICVNSISRRVLYEINNLRFERGLPDLENSTLVRS